MKNLLRILVFLTAALLPAMAQTPNIVPRADGEGGIGRTDKKWGFVWAYTNRASYFIGDGSLLTGLAGGGDVTSGMLVQATNDAYAYARAIAMAYTNPIPAWIISQGAANTNHAAAILQSATNYANGVTNSSLVRQAELTAASNTLFGAISGTGNNSYGGVGLTNGDVSIPTNKSLIIQAGAKGFEMKNGFWWAGPIPYLRPTTVGPLAFDIMPKSPDATAYDVWLDICGMDIENCGNNYETLKLYKAAGGDAIIGTTKSGTGTLRALQIQDGNAGLKLGSGGGAVYVGSGGGTVNIGPLSPPSIIEIQANASASGDIPAGFTMRSLHTNWTFLPSSAINNGSYWMYYNGASKSFLEITNPPSGWGTLRLMKGGGAVTAGGDLTVATNITATSGTITGNGAGITNSPISKLSLDNLNLGAYTNIICGRIPILATNGITYYITISTNAP